MSLITPLKEEAEKFLRSLQKEKEEAKKEVKKSKDVRAKVIEFLKRKSK